MTTNGPDYQRAEQIRQFARQSPCICFNLRKAARSVTQIYDHMFREIGLTAGQISILFSLATIGQMTVTELSQAMAADRTTITRNLKPLVRDELLAVSVGQDKRSRRISITPKGLDMCQRSRQIIGDFEQRLDHKIGSDRIQQFCQELNQTVELIQNI